MHRLRGVNANDPDSRLTGFGDLDGVPVNHVRHQVSDDLALLFRRCLGRPPLCTLPLLAGENISARFVLPTVASSVDIVVHIGVEADGRRRVREIVAVPGRVEADVIETEAIFASRDGRLARAQGMPPRPERFAVAGVDVQQILGAGDSPALQVGG